MAMAEQRVAVQEVGGAVERVDDPAVGLVGPLHRAALLHQEAVARAGLRQLAEQRFLGAVVGRRHEVGRPLHRHLQLLDLAEIARQAAAGFARGGNHHVHQSGCGHRLSGFPWRRLLSKSVPDLAQRTATYKRAARRLASGRNVLFLFLTRSIASATFVAGGDGRTRCRMTRWFGSAWNGGKATGATASRSSAAVCTPP